MSNYPIHSIIYYVIRNSCPPFLIQIWPPQTAAAENAPAYGWAEKRQHTQADSRCYHVTASQRPLPASHNTCSATVLDGDSIWTGPSLILYHKASRAAKPGRTSSVVRIELGLGGRRQCSFGVDQYTCQVVLMNTCARPARLRYRTIQVT